MMLWKMIKFHFQGVYIIYSQVDYPTFIFQGPKLKPRFRPNFQGPKHPFFLGSHVSSSGVFSMLMLESYHQQRGCIKGFAVLDAFGPQKKTAHKTHHVFSGFFPPSQVMFKKNTHIEYRHIAKPL